MPLPFAPQPISDWQTTNPSKGGEIKKKEKAKQKKGKREKEGQATENEDDRRVVCLPRRFAYFEEETEYK